MIKLEKKMVNKVLNFLFVILFLVIAVEVVFYFVYLQPRSRSLSITPALIPSTNQTKPIDIQDKNSPSSSMSADQTNYYNINFTRTIPLDLLLSSQMTTKLHGEVLNSEYLDQTKYTSDEKTGQKLHYRFIILLKTKTGKYGYSYDTNSLSKLKAVKQIGNQEQPISLAEIKPGNQVLIEQVIDLTKPESNDENLISFKLTIVQ